jgi:hypothetical protein
MNDEFIAISAVVVPLEGRIGVRPSNIANDTAAVIKAEMTTATPIHAVPRRPAISSKRVPVLEGSKSAIGIVGWVIVVWLKLICAYHATLCGRITTNSVGSFSICVSRLKFIFKSNLKRAAFYKQQCLNHESFCEPYYG